MESPQKTEQDTVSTEDMLSEEFDRMEAAGEGANDLDTEIELEAETEIAAEAEAEADVETETVVEASEEKSELTEEIQDAAESDYNEPAPERWKPEMQEMYNGLPPHARKALLEGIYKPMQKTYTQSTQELAGMRKSIEPMLQTMQQHENTFQRMGVNPAEAFNTQMAWIAHINTVGAEKGIADMQQAYGVGTPKKAAGQEEYLTPTERAFKEQISALQNQVSGQQQQTQQFTQQQAQQAEDNARNEIQQNLNTFINEKTDDGNPAHPHVEKVASGIAGIIRGGLVSKTDDYGQPVAIRDQLAQAYTMACNLDPSIRTPIPGKRQAALIKTAQNAQVVTKTPAGHVSTDDDMPMSSFIEQEWERLNRSA